MWQSGTGEGGCGGGGRGGDQGRHGGGDRASLVAGAFSHRPGGGPGQRYHLAPHGDDDGAGKRAP
ncbi:MAG: hypothetical protein F4179_06945, partial [Gammaproteobacteria bacterium]|nr:hypothetical protein [Gammaproteobacteria bacterium]